MRGLIAAGMVVLAAGVLTAQTQKTPETPAKDTALTLTGCISPTAGEDGNFTFTQSSNGSRYRLTGKNLKQYAGQRVEIVSAKSGGLTIRGGLYPSANVAGQAGHIDSAQAAIASQPGVHNTGKSEGRLPEVRVSTVRAVEGICK
jgi:hypothetical protein